MEICLSIYLSTLEIYVWFLDRLVVLHYFAVEILKRLLQKLAVLKKLSIQKQVLVSQ